MAKMVTVVMDHALAETVIERKESDGEEREEKKRRGSRGEEIETGLSKQPVP